MAGHMLDEKAVLTFLQLGDPGFPMICLFKGFHNPCPAFIRVWHRGLAWAICDDTLASLAVLGLAELIEIALADVETSDLRLFFQKRWPFTWLKVDDLAHLWFMARPWTGGHLLDGLYRPLLGLWHPHDCAGVPYASHLGVVHHVLVGLPFNSQPDPSAPSPRGACYATFLCPGFVLAHLSKW